MTYNANVLAGDSSEVGNSIVVRGSLIKIVLGFDFGKK